MEYYTFRAFVPNVLATSLFLLCVEIDSVLEETSETASTIWLLATLEAEGIILGELSSFLLIASLAVLGLLLSTMLCAIFWNRLIAQVSRVKRIKLGQSYLFFLCVSWISWLLSWG